jgi:hydrogenase expression/formation protein HypE
MRMAADHEKDAGTGFHCPIPISQYPRVLLAHGGGGQLTHQLIERMFVPTFGSPALDTKHDGAILQIGSTRLAFTTDSHVVQSMRRTAAATGVSLVTGDTKVVDRGKGDGIFINTAGVGALATDRPIAPASVRAGDVLLLSGDIGRHGMAIMAARESLAFDSAIESDCAPLVDPVMALLEADLPVHCLRDLTRGGLASALVEIAEASGLHVRVDERAIPAREDVRGACEILGLDPLYVANEGRFVAFVAPEAADRALQILRAHPVSAGATVIGTVTADPAGLVTLRSAIGTSRIVDMLTGEQLPRIC